MRNPFKDRLGAFILILLMVLTGCVQLIRGEQPTR